MVVLVERHLKVDADKLGHVSVRERVLRTEHGPNLEDAPKVGADCHLLVQLRRLRQVRLCLEVRHAEHVRAALACGADDLGRVDFDEAVRQEERTRELAHGRLHRKDCLVRRDAQVDDAVVEARVQPDADRIGTGFVANGLRLACVLQLEGKHLACARKHVEPLNGKLDIVLAARLDWHCCAHDPATHVDDRLLGDRTDELDHLLAHRRVIDARNGLQRVVLLAQDNKDRLAGTARVVQPCADPDRLRDGALANFAKLRPRCRPACRRLVQREVAVVVGGKVRLCTSLLLAVQSRLRLCLPLLLLCGLLLLLERALARREAELIDCCGELTIVHCDRLIDSLALSQNSCAGPE